MKEYYDNEGIKRAWDSLQETVNIIMVIMGQVAGFDFFLIICCTYVFQLGCCGIRTDKNTYNSWKNIGSKTVPKSCCDDCKNNFDMTGCLDLWDEYKPIIIGSGIGVLLIMVM